MPDWKREVRDALTHLNLEPGREESIVEELAEHLIEQHAELVHNGVPESEAHNRVLRDLRENKFAAALQPIFRQEPQPMTPVTSTRGGMFFGLGMDVRLAARMLKLSPGFATVAILSLALGVGANTAIFQLIDAVVLRTLPVPAPQTLADVRVIHNGRLGNTVSRQHEISSAIWEQLRKHQQAFSTIAAWSTSRFDLGHGGDAHYVDGLWVSGDFFQTLRIRPTLGRLFSASDDREGCGNEGVVISYSFWKSEFGGRPDVLGTFVSLDGHPFPILGVTPATFSGLEVGRKFDVALPLCSEPFLDTEYVWSKSPITWWLALSHGFVQVGPWSERLRSWLLWRPLCLRRHCLCNTMPLRERTIYISASGHHPRPQAFPD